MTTVGVWADSVTNSTGDPQPSVPFTVYTTQTGSVVATIYTDSTGATPIAGATTTSDAGGNAVVYAAPGLYWGQAAGQSYRFAIVASLSGADLPGTELASAVLGSSVFGFGVTTSYQDIPNPTATGPAFLIAPTFATRGGYLELALGAVTTSATGTFFVALYDVTASAYVGGAGKDFQASSPNGYTSFTARVPVSPGAGLRTYKAQMRSTAAATVNLYTVDPGVSGTVVGHSLTCVTR